MPKVFKNKNYWSLILGASSGLGLATAKKLAKGGMNIFAIHRDRKSDLPGIEKHFKEIISEGVSFLSFNSDALKAETRSQIISGIKKKLKPGEKIRVLVHSIAKGNLKPMITDNETALKNDDFHLTIDAMAVSLYDWTKELFSNNLFSPDARVISFTSEGNQKVWKNYAAVSAAKAALEAITRNIAFEFAPYGIRANCIQSGVTDTQSLRLIPGSEQLKEVTIKRNPFKKLTTPEDVANVVYLLSLDEASWINGAIIPADGGEHIA